MIQKKEFKSIKVSRAVYDRLIKDRDEFQEKIGGGNWSISDTISEYLGILNTLKDKE